MTSTIITESTNCLTACTHKNDFNQEFGLIDIFNTGEVNFSFDGKKPYSTIPLQELKDFIIQAEKKFQKQSTVNSNELPFLDKMLFDTCGKDPVLFECHKKIEKEQDKYVLGNEEQQKSAIKPSKLIFQWVKTGHINHKQFVHLANRWNIED